MCIRDRYYRVSNLLEEIRVSRMAGNYTKTLAKISKFKLLLLDDFGVSALRPVSYTHLTLPTSDLV